jgi:hypothetical protein
MRCVMGTGTHTKSESSDAMMLKGPSSEGPFFRAVAVDYKSDKLVRWVCIAM